MPLWEDVADRLNALKEHREDAHKIGSAEKLRPLRKHFLGAIVVGSPATFDSKAVPTREVIDGQQRITTLQIMLLALRDAIAPLDDPAIGDDVLSLTYNKGNYEAKKDHFKVWPTNAGRDVMQVLSSAGSMKEVCNRYPAKDKSRQKVERPLMVQAYLFFYSMLMALMRGKNHDDLAHEQETDEGNTIAHAVIRSIDKDNDILIPYINIPASIEPISLLLDSLQTCFQIMRLQLDNEDDPQIIFETLNARGAPLQPSDLIRNFLFLTASRQNEDVDDLYKNYWQEFDEKTEIGTTVKGQKFWKKEERQGLLKNSRLDLLLYHYVGLRKQEETKVAYVFEEFKNWWELERRDTAQELQKLTRISGPFETLIAPGQSSRFELLCRRMKLLDTTTQTPLIFHLIEHNEIDGPDFLQAIDYLESYFVRRFICGLTAKSYNRVFLNRLLAEMVAERKSDSATLRNLLLRLEGDSQRWPDDAEFRSAWSHRQLYQGRNTRKVRAVLEALEFAQRGSKQEFTPTLDTLSVEHVLPQSWKPEDWPLVDDSSEGKEKRVRLLHSIGNLTLVTPSFNSALSNEPFRVKRPELAKNSSLMLNAYFQSFADSDAWNELTIVDRADKLFGYATALWPRPSP